MSKIEKEQTFWDTFSAIDFWREGNGFSCPRMVGKKNQGIFRSTPFRKKSSSAKTVAETPVIEAAITYTLSEDEASCNIVLDDIENQFSAEELQVENANDVIAFDATNPVVATSETADVEAPAPTKPKKSDNEETMTFTHLEIMRNELAHMMQIANKDKEIYQLTQQAEEIQKQHAQIVAEKDAEIARIASALQEVESVLAQTQDKLALEELEHSKTIEVLMETQYEYHEISNKSWFESLTCALF